LTVEQFFLVFLDYLVDVLPYLAIGLLLSGLIHEFVSPEWVDRHLGGGGIRPLLYCTFAGTIIPLCCLGALPVALSLHRKGARLGSVLAFLVATPATSITALLVCYALLGIGFTAFLYLAVVVMGLTMGLVGNLIGRRVSVQSPQCECTARDPVCGATVEMDGATSAECRGEVYYFCCSHCREAFEKKPDEYVGAGSRNVAHRMKHVFRYAFVDMVKDIGPWLLLGLALAALVTAAAPIGEFVGDHLSGALGFPFGLGLGLIIYVCSTASVPLVDALVLQGLNIGAGMVILLVGPITSWGNILVLRKELGSRILAVYLLVVSAMSLLLGYLYSLL